MENYLLNNNENIDGLNDKDLYKKIKSKKKIKAYQIQIKEFFSDNEDEDFKSNKYGVIEKYSNQRKVKTKCISKKTKNSILVYKAQIQKKSIIEKTPNKNKERQNLFKEDISSKNTCRNKKLKKVNFPENDFVVYIDIESFKNYNCNNSNIYPFRENKVNSKCCIIF